MKTFLRRSGKLKGILKKPKKIVSNSSFKAAPNALQPVIPESWIWRLELGVIFASAALILFSGVMRSRMVHLEKICKDFISSKNINSILAKYEQSAHNLVPIIDEKLKSLADDIGTSQNLTAFYEELLSNITDSLVQINATIGKIVYQKNFINSSSLMNRRDCEDLQSYVTESERNIDNLTLRVQSLSSDFQSILAQMNNVRNIIKNNVVPKDFVYIQLAGYPEPVTLWPTVRWQQIKYQASPYIQIYDGESIYGRVTLSFPNKNEIMENIEVDVSTVPSGFSPGSSYLLKPSSAGVYDLVLDMDEFPYAQPKARKVRLWKRL